MRSVWTTLLFLAAWAWTLDGSAGDGVQQVAGTAAGGPRALKGPAVLAVPCRVQGFARPPPPPSPRPQSVNTLGAKILLHRARHKWRRA